MEALSSAFLTITILLIFTVTGKPIGEHTPIFSFGDSLADTGNRQAHSLERHNCYSPPYGKTFFHHPTGRCSDGRLIIDFITEFLGIPKLPPYLAVKNKSLDNFWWGVNFAVAGSTAVDYEFYQKRGIDNKATNSSLGSQLNWFKELLPSLCHSFPNCRELLQRSLFFVGEIGGNDFNHAFYVKRSLDEILSFVPVVVDTISSAISELIKQGARDIVVPGILPNGCSVIYLSTYRSSNKEEYDPAGCLIWVNNFSKFYNEQLQKELNRIQLYHPHTNVIYADYYNAAMRFYQDPDKFGFRSGALIACCGEGGPRNFNLSALCGPDSAIVCDDPSSYVSWDGIHLTEAAYRWIAIALLEDSAFFQKLSSSI